MKRSLLLVALFTLSACDYLEKADFDRERSDRAYRAAMEDYRAGRLVAALEGLQKVCSIDPLNTSARFQLACLLQDGKKDYLAAYCAYHEYLVQAPTSDKARLARERLTECEREAARALASQYGLNVAEDGQRAALAVQEKLTATEKRLQKQTKDLEAATQRLVALQAENERLKSFLHSAAEEKDAGEKSVTADDLSEAKALLSDAEELPPPAPVKKNDIQEAQSLLAEIQDEKSSPEPPADVKPTRPATYVVQEGESLYKIALKFYGRTSAWSRIRDANKAVISTDGRVRAGQKIVLPAE